MKRLCVGILVLGVVSCSSPETSDNSAANSPSEAAEAMTATPIMKLPELTGEYVWLVDKTKSKVGFDLDQLE